MLFNSLQRYYITRFECVTKVAPLDGSVLGRLNLHSVFDFQLSVIVPHGFRPLFDLVRWKLQTSTSHFRPPNRRLISIRLRLRK